MEQNLSNLGPKELAKTIDHTLLKPEASEGEVRKLIEEALEYGFYSICIEAKWLPLAVPALAGSSVLPITVIGFPAGTESTEQKVRETEQAVRNGAKEIDMVLNLDLLKERKLQEAHNDIAEVIKAAANNPVKVILETSELSRDEIILACGICKAAGADFVKTSTGFTKAGAKAEDVSLMRAMVGKDVGVKASGGIRDLESVKKMIDSGASRLGMSASVAVVKEAANQK